MKFQIPKKAFLAAAQRAATATPRKPAITALGFLHLSLKEGKLTLTGTDLYTVVSVVTGATGADGEALANAALLIERLKSLPDGDVVVTADAKAMTIKTDGSVRKHVIPTLPASDFPPIHADAATTNSRLSTESLRRLLDHTTHSSGRDQSRPQMYGVLVESDGSSLRAVSTDGHRLALATAKAPENANFRVLLAFESLKAIRGVLDEDVEMVDFQVARGWCVIKTPSVVVTVKVTEAEFPQYEHVIPGYRELIAGKTPAWQTTTAIVPRSAMLDAVRAVVGTNGAISMTFAKAGVSMTAKDGSGAESFDEVPGEVELSADVTIGIQGRYLEEALGTMPGNDVKMLIADDRDPIVVTAVGDEPLRIEVVMPMLLN